MEEHKNNIENSTESPQEYNQEKAKYSFRVMLKKYRDSYVKQKDRKDHEGTTEDCSDTLKVGELTLKYLPFILTRVKKKHIQYYRRHSYEELLEEAILASLLSEKRFNPTLGWDFTTYAKYDIDGALTKFVSTLSNTQLTLYNKMLKFIDKYSSEYGKHPSKRSIIDGLNISEEKYTHLLQDLEPPSIVPYMKLQVNNETHEEEVEAGVEEASQESEVIIQDILKIIKDLESPTREIIEMSVIQEMSIDSVASFLGVTKQAAQGRIDSAKAELRDILELHGITG